MRFIFILRSIVILIAILCIVNVIARYHIVYNYVYQIEKTIIISCNIKTFHETTNEAVYKCITNKNNNCNIITRYNDYNMILNSCIDDKRSLCGFGVFIAVMICFFISIYN
jgi:hypothetical protein